MDNLTMIRNKFPNYYEREEYVPERKYFPQYNNAP